MTLRSLSVLLVVMVIAGCGGSDDAKGPTATVGTSSTESTTTTTKALTPEEEVEAAYLKSWDVYAKAVRELDDSHLGDVYADDALALRRDEIAELKRNNTPAVVNVKHDYVISLFDGGARALVIDSYLNHSRFVDPATGQPTEPDPNEVVKRQYVLGMREGTWKIVSAKALA